MPQAGHDMRDASVRELQRRFGVDTAPGRACRTRGAGAVRQRGSPTPTRRERGASCGWACALHEIGHDGVAPRPPPPQRLPAGHVDAAGFSQSQQRRIGDLVLGQRGGLRKVEASAGATPQFAWQVLCLRLAVIKCHARGAIDATRWRCSCSATTAGAC